MPITFGGLRAFSRVLMPSMVKRGLSANKIITNLKTRGYSYRRKVMLQDIREFTGLVKMERYTRAFSGDVQFSKFGMVELKLGRDRRYRVFGKMTTRNTLTGEESDRFISFYDMEQRSKDQWIEAFEDQYEEKSYQKNEEIVSTDIYSVEHNQKWTY